MRYELDERELAKLSPEDRARVQDEFAALERRLQRSPLEAWTPHLMQRKFLAAKVRAKLFAGGNRSGKTTCGIVDDLIQSLSREDVPAHLIDCKKWEPPFHLRILTPDLIDTQEEVLHPKIRALCPPHALRGGSFDKAYSQKNRKLYFANGSSWQFMSFEQDLSKMGGAALHRIHYDEEPPESVRSECQVRLWDYGGDELFTMTPLLGLTWMFDDIYLAAKEDPNIVVVEVDVEHNRENVHWESVEADLAKYSAEERAARKSGRFVSFAGLIYGEDFDKELHVIDVAPVPEMAEVYVGIDPGMEFMCATVWCYLTPEDELVVFDEYAATSQETIATVCVEIHRRNLEHGVKPRFYVIDPAARSRNMQTGRSDQSEFAEHGVVALPGQNPVIPGISAVKARLQAKRLSVMAHCTETIREFERYRWAGRKKSKEQVEDDRRSKPVKKDDHLLDALRYVVMQKPLRPDILSGPDTRSQAQRLLDEDIRASSGGSTLPQTEYGSLYA